MRKILNVLILLTALLLTFASPAFAQLSTSAVSGIIYDATGTPLAKTTILFNVPQQIISEEVVGPGIVSAITDANGNVSINLPRKAIMQITISTGMPIQGIVPDTVTSTFADVVAGTNLFTSPWNLTGPITSVDKATSIASQTGTGTKFVVDTSPTILSPTLVTPALGTPASGVLTNATGIPAANLLIANQAALDLLYASSSTVWARLPKGTANQVLAMDGTAANFTWASGVVTAVTASTPLASSGGNAPNITLPNVVITATDTAIGTSALASNTTGLYNTAGGASALFSNTGGDANNNTAFGYSALKSNTTGYTNTAFGSNALYSCTTCTENTAGGNHALYTNITGYGNTAFGSNALSSAIGHYNTAIGLQALQSATTGGNENTAVGHHALVANSTGYENSASGGYALFTNTTGYRNSAFGYNADVASANLFNATAIGYSASVNASNKIRLGDAGVSVIEGQVDFTFISDKAQKENFQPVDGEEVLKKIAGFELTSWNYIGHDPKEFRHYGPMAQDFFAAFGNDGIGTIGTPTTMNSGNTVGILMIAIQTLEKQNRDLKARVERLEGR